jgi:LemA protein
MRTEWIVIAVLAVLALGAIAVFNRLVRQRNLVREGWSGIDVQLKRRSDLIPNLVETVKSYASHERGVFEDVTARRAASAGIAAVPAKAEAERALQGAVGRLIAVAEAYPQLKADESFRALQGQLAEIERLGRRRIVGRRRGGGGGSGW